MVVRQWDVGVRVGGCVGRCLDCQPNAGLPSMQQKCAGLRPSAYQTPKILKYFDHCVDRGRSVAGHHMSVFLLDLLVAPIVIAGLGLTPLQLVFFIPPAAGAVATVQEFLRAEKENGHGD